MLLNVDVHLAASGPSLLIFFILSDSRQVIAVPSFVIRIIFLIMQVLNLEVVSLTWHIDDKVLVARSTTFFLFRTLNESLDIFGIFVLMASLLPLLKPCHPCLFLLRRLLLLRSLAPGCVRC